MKATELLLASILAVGLCSPLFAADANKQCMKCHKRNGTMAGVHATIGNDGLSCVRCHGKQGKHPRDKTALTTFGQDSVTPMPQQQQSCQRCHSSSKLRKVEWTHDVHRNKLACSSCHQLHPETDPMVNISPAARSVSCANCHGEQQQGAMQ